MQCPKCGQAVEQDFGVFPCVKCHTVLFVDMEGQVQISEKASEDAIGTEAAELAPPPPPPPPPLPPPPESPPNVFQAIKMANPQFEEVVVPVVFPPEMPVQSLREEMTAFANAEGVPGGLNYIVRIDQIDTSELRNRVHDALADRKFRWDAKELISKITKGSLLIQDVSAAKAIVLISRLQELPVQVSWHQKSL